MPSSADRLMALKQKAEQASAERAQLEAKSQLLETRRKELEDQLEEALGTRDADEADKRIEEMELSLQKKLADLEKEMA